MKHLKKWTVSILQIAVDGDKIIPCSLVFRMFQPYGKDGETFTFTDTKPTDEISCVSKYFELDLYKEHLADYQKKDYDYIDKKFKDGKVTKAEYEENKTNPWGTSIDYSDETFIKDGKYVVKQVNILGTEDQTLPLTSLKLRLLLFKIGANSLWKK